MVEIIGTELNDVLLGTDGDDLIYGVDSWLQIVSTDPDGTQGSSHSYDALISDDGRLVVFSSLSPDLPGAQTSGWVPDIYVKNIETGELTWIGEGTAIDITPNGSHILTQQGLLIDVASGSSVHFAYDLQQQPVTDSFGGFHFSDDGRMIIFDSAQAITADDANGYYDVYVKDIASGHIERVSLDEAGGDANANSVAFALVDGGTKAVFMSDASNLVAGTTPGVSRYYIKDLLTGVVQQLSFGIPDEEAQLSIVGLNFSADGSKAVFASAHDGLVPGDTNGESDVFVMDVATGVVTRVSTNADGDEVVRSINYGDIHSGAVSPIISADGTRVIFFCDIWFEQGSHDHIGLFMKDLVTGDVTLVSRPLHNPFDSSHLYGTGSISGDGSLMVFASAADGFAGANDGGIFDVFLRHLDPVPGDGDEAYGQEGNDFLYGSYGNDKLDGGVGDDQLYGMDGLDWLYGLDGADKLYGGKGTDALFGGHGDDTLYGEAAGDSLDGGDGQDFLIGGDGVDWLYGGEGNDYLYGDERDPGYVYGHELLPDGSTDAMFGEGGDDFLAGGGGGDSLDGGAGRDRLYGGYGVDWLYGGSGNDKLWGEADSDALFGQEDDDTLWGGDGSDSLDGGAGHDRLIGGEGIDTLTGGAGGDVFYFDTSKPNELGDLIMDFETGLDKLEVKVETPSWKLVLRSGEGLPYELPYHSNTFYFETETRSLWFDIDGRSTANMIHIAGFETGVIEAGDILLV